MTDIELDDSVPAALLAIRTDNPLRDKPRQVKPRPVAYAPPQEWHEEAQASGHRAKGVGKWIGGKFATAVIANLAFMLFMHHVGLAKMIRVICTIGTTVTGRDKDTEVIVNRVLDESKGVAATPKPTVTEKIKQAAERPVEVVKEGAKKTVAKAEQKADELKEAAKEEAAEIKDAIQGFNGDSSSRANMEQPGLLAQAGQTLSNAKDATANKVAEVAQSFQGQQPSFAEVQRRRLAAAYAADYDRKAYLRRKNQYQLDIIGGAVDMGAAAAYRSYQNGLNNQINWAHQMMQEQTAQQNAAIQRTNAYIRGQR